MWKIQTPTSNCNIKIKIQSLMISFLVISSTFLWHWDEGSPWLWCYIRYELLKKGYYNVVPLSPTRFPSITITQHILKRPLTLQLNRKLKNEWKLDLGMFMNSLYALIPKHLVHYIHKDTVLKFSNHIYWQDIQVYKTSKDTCFSTTYTIQIWMTKCLLFKAFCQFHFCAPWP